VSTDDTRPPLDDLGHYMEATSRLRARAVAAETELETLQVAREDHFAALVSEKEAAERRFSEENRRANDLAAALREIGAHPISNDFGDEDPNAYAMQSIARAALDQQEQT
jgi:hypothetical protein